MLFCDFLSSQDGLTLSTTAKSTVSEVEGMPTKEDGDSQILDKGNLVDEKEGDQNQEKVIRGEVTVMYA